MSESCLFPIMSIHGTRILINGRPTYSGSEKAEGLFFNLRMVNSTFSEAPIIPV